MEKFKFVMPVITVIFVERATVFGDFEAKPSYSVGIVCIDLEYTCY
jgi:hypothetical protein